MIDELRKILTENYAALGWRLHKLDEEQGSYYRGTIECPCGGIEYFCVMVDAVLDPRPLAMEILFATASVAHLQDDIAKGALPTMDVSKHSFQGVLL